ncbi:2-oxoacid dehydrogenases acyltransferase-domain-containing protein [Vararia minispora EC-137]|uniref:2-oxoacid dehydrogenases acyltransferase-domain-containing protein n=1 Tax=Vararia minispora EC-137 TaxID=1314806 RepID=A0ACB8QPM0_9AGAM|nr:2-oxoacid dehydrogenases acyltransferase-domain-containing protein [Vararia minispora EC-137]
MLLLPRRVSFFYRPYVRLFHASTARARKVLQEFRLADIGEGITECEVIKWSVRPLSMVEQFQQLCEVQSDKASVEITSPFDGVLKELLVQEGAVAKVGEPLCIIEVEVSQTDDAADSPSSSTFIEAEAARPSPTPIHDAILHEPEQARRSHPLDPNVDVLALPSVRHFARQNGVDIALLAPGRGKGGRVEKADVEQYLAGATPVSHSFTPSGEDVVVELGRTRYGMWKSMTKSLEIPHFGYSTHLDITALNALLPTLNLHIPTHYLPPSASGRAPPPSVVSPSSFYPSPPPPEVSPPARLSKITYLPVLLKTLSKAMQEWPLFRSSITPGGEDSARPTLTLRPHADIAIALSTPTGLYTPVLRAVDTHSIYALASELRRLAHAGRQVPHVLTPTDMPRRGATITVSNVGAVGEGSGASPVLVPGGGVAIVALGRARWEIDVDKYDGARRLRLPISWAADHRVVEGAELAAFVESWRAWVEHPERMIGEGV